MSADPPEHMLMSSPASGALTLADDEYINSHRDAIEEALSLVTEQLLHKRVDDPVKFISSQFGISAPPSISTPPPEDAGILPNSEQKDFAWAVRRALDSIKDGKKKPMDSVEAEKRKVEQRPWLAKSWLDSLHITELLAEKLLAELKLTDKDPLLEKPFICYLSSYSDHNVLARILEKQGFFDELARKIHVESQKLKQAQDNSRKGDTNAKFVSEEFKFGDSEEFKFGDLKTFFEGLDNFIGPPNPNLDEAMRNEHCIDKDSNKFFVAPNYKTKTKPKIEWHFVNSSDSMKALESLQIQEWPREEQNIEDGEARPAATSLSREAGDRRRRPIVVQS